jgi:hypothetical protein
MYSDDMCGRLLAFAALSNAEDVVLNTALNAAIMCASDLFNIGGGLVPHPAKLPFFTRAMLDLRNNGCAATWWPTFAERYSIDARRFPLLTETFKDQFDYLFKGSGMFSKLEVRQREDREEEDERKPAPYRAPDAPPWDDDRKPAPLPPRLLEKFANMPKPRPRE